MRFRVIAAAGLAAAALAGCGGHAHTAGPPPPSTPPGPTLRHGYYGTSALAGGTAPDFVLHDQRREVVRLSAQRGHYVLLTFLYTECPDVCPLIAANVNEALRELPARTRGDVRALAVSTDPVHDTRAAVARYVVTHQFVPQFRYLIGSRDELKPIWQAYNILVEPTGGQRVSHSTYVLLLDPRGKPRLYYPPQVTAQELRHDLARLLTRSA